MNRDHGIWENSRAARMCPRCASDSLVYDSREQDDGRIMRKRRCKVCGVCFKTMEQLEQIIEGEC